MGTRVIEFVILHMPSGKPQSILWQVYTERKGSGAFNTAYERLELTNGSEEGPPLECWPRKLAFAGGVRDAEKPLWFKWSPIEKFLN